MNEKITAPISRLTVITLGVSNMRASIAFYEALGFKRKLRETGEAVAFFETGATVIGLFRGTNWRRTPLFPRNRARGRFAA